MDFLSIEQFGNKTSVVTDQNQNLQESALLEAAKQFEAILLMQLTSVLNKTGDEDSLFGSDGGSELAQKMFSEQLATAMAESGGIGLTDVIMKQFNPNKIKTIAIEKNPLSNVINAVKDIRSKRSDVSGLIDRSGKVIPVDNDITFASGDIEVISTDEEVYGQNSEAEDWRKPFIDKRFAIEYSASENMTNNAVSPVSNVNSLTKSSNKLEFQMPLEGVITSRFGKRFHPIDKVMKFHGGVDISAKRGTPIKAAGEGVVKFAERNGDYGNMVIIEHPDGRISRYAHADKLLVKKDQKVQAGQEIATVGTTGKSTGPHLHFEMFKDGKRVDPLKDISNVSEKNADK